MRRILPLLFASLGAACTDSPPIEPHPEPEVASVKIGPYQSRVQVGVSQQLQVTVTGIENKEVYYGYRASEVGGIAANDSYIVRLNKLTGSFVANSVGKATLVVRSKVYGDKIDTAVITVDLPPPDRRVAFSSLATSEGRTCGLTSSGDAYCWGANRSGALGAQATSLCGFGQIETDYPCNPLPARVNNAVKFAQVVVGPEHSCALTTAGIVYCWGRNTWGEVGNGTSAPITTPVQISIPGKIVSLSAGRGRSCAANDVGDLYCWGIIWGSVLLDPFGGPGCFSTGRCSSIPVLVDGLTNVTQVSVGHGHTCALQSNGAAYCWGANFFGYLGTGDYAETNTPRRVETDIQFVKITAGNVVTCGLTISGQAYCWGMMGVPFDSCDKSPTTCSNVPRAVETSLRFTDVVAKYQGACGLTAGNEMYCWGANTLLGLSDTGSVLVPTRMLTGISVIAIASGYRTCAVTSGGTAYCWSRSNGAGEQGNGTLSPQFGSTYSPAPTLVEGPPGS